MEIINWNKEEQEAKIGVPRYTGNIVVGENGVPVAESVIDKKTTEDIIFEVVGSDRVKFTSITELKSSNSSLSQLIADSEDEEKISKYQSMIDENNLIIEKINETYG